MITNDLQIIASKIQKVAQLAFDPAATPGEMKNAITKIVELAQKYGINYRDFKLLLGLIVPAEQSSPQPVKPKMPVSEQQSRTNEEILRMVNFYTNKIIRQNRRS